MSFESIKYLWMNGAIKPWAEGTVHVAAHVVHYGSGVFEGIRCYSTDAGSAVFRLAPHLARFYASAELYHMRIPYAPAELEAAISEVITRNGFTDCYIRPVAYYGIGGLSLNPRQCPVEVAIFAWNWGAYLGEEGLKQGVRVTFVSWTKLHQSMLPTIAKGCGQYLNSILAVREANDQGYDEAILINRDGYLSEGSGENLFIIKDGVIRTNDEESSILLGITRDAVLQIATDLGFKVEIGLLRKEDLLTADEAFFTGTAVEVTPIREAAGKVIGTGERGPVTAEIQRVFFDAVRGRDARYREWLSPVTQAVAL
jgi:branched-chain amino acid aminotransferase